MVEDLDTPLSHFSPVPSHENGADICYLKSCVPLLRSLRAVLEQREAVYVSIHVLIYQLTFAQLGPSCSEVYDQKGRKQPPLLGNGLYQLVHTKP